MAVITDEEKTLVVSGEQIEEAVTKIPTIEADIKENASNIEKTNSRIDELENNSNSELAAQVNQNKTDILSVNGKLSNLTLGLHTDGLFYIFINNEPVGNGISLPQASGDVYGNVDSENNIVLNGDLADGEYFIKYEMADGSTIDIGELVLDTTEPDMPTEPTNWADPSNSLWQVGYRLATAYGNGKTDGGIGHILTNFIPAQKGDIIYVTGLDITGASDGKNAMIGAYNSNNDPETDYQKLYAATGATTAVSSADGAKECVVLNGSTYEYTVLMTTNNGNKATDSTRYIRIDGIAVEGVLDSEIVINVKRNGVWL